MNYINLFYMSRRLLVLSAVVIYTCMAGALLYGQKVTPKSELRKTLDFMFENIDKGAVPTGLLRDYAVEEEDLDIFSGNAVLNDDNIGTLVRYGNLLETVGSAALLKDPTEEFENSLRNFKSVNEGNVMLSVMLYKYARIKENALTDGLIRYENGQVYNTQTKESPYKIGYIFAGCSLNATVYQPNVTIVLPAKFLLTNCDIQRIELDYGSGYQEIIPSNSIRVVLNKGLNKLTIKATLQDGRVLFAHTIVQVADEPIRAKTKSLLIGKASYEFKIKGKAYNGVSTSADISIAYAQGNSSVKKPLIIVEGFDPRVISGFPKGYWNFQDRVLDDQNVSVLNSSEYGYDIVYVDWEKPEEYMQANANTLIAVIDWVNQEKGRNGSQEPGVIIGHSMGGIIARYALKTMENQGVRHQISTYVSYDVPHLGAHIPLGVLYGFHGMLSFIEGRGITKTLLSKYTQLNDYINLGKSLAYATSAQQMLVNFVDPAGYFNNQEHVLWQKELNALGFPKGDLGGTFKMLAVANGSYVSPTIPEYYTKTDFSGGTDLTNFFPLLSGIAVGVGLNDIVSGLLTLLPGRTAIDGAFEIFPAKAAGDLITRISIKFKKNFLWFIPITKEVFSYNKNSPGGYLYDTYPSSSYGIKRDSKGIPILVGGGIPNIYDYKSDVKVSNYIPFIPTSSALAYGDGLSSSTSNFFTAPNGLDSPFGNNYYTHVESNTHDLFTRNGIDWIKASLSTSIIGPRVGYEGARYRLSSASAGVTWSSSNTAIATINSSGILSVRGKGVVVLTAVYLDQRYSQTILVGFPRYILTASHEPGGYKVVAESIDLEYKDYQSQLNGLLRFNWGVKYPGQEIRWMETDKSELKVQLQGQNEQVTIFLEVGDELGNKSAVQQVVVNSQDIYVASNQNLYVDSQGIMYRENKTKYLYQIARVYLRYSSGIAEKYKGREWMPLSAVVLSPFSEPRTITVQNGGPLIKDIMSLAELEIIKNSSEDNQRYTYMLVLLNYEHKAIQYMPVTFTFKRTI